MHIFHLNHIQLCMMKSKVVKIVLAVLSIVIVAVLGSVFVGIGMEWFGGLNRPSQWIPEVIIPIVWSVIYIMFGIVLSLWISKGDIPRDIIVWLVVNGILNILWCLVFFTLRLTFVGNIVIILNLIVSIVLFKKIRKVEPFYAFLISIYPIWLCLATSLNTALWILN